MRNPNQTISSNNQAHRSAQLVSALELLNVASEHACKTPVTSPAITALQAQDLYICMRAGNPGFVKMTKIAFAELIKCCGDRALSNYRRNDVNKLVFAILERCVATTAIRRRLKSLSAGFGLVIREKELSIANPFEKVIIPIEGE